LVGQAFRRSFILGSSGGKVYRLIRRNSTQKFSNEIACPSYIYSMRHIPNKDQALLQAVLLSSSVEGGEGRKMV
jgi:hypothetical protein